MYNAKISVWVKSDLIKYFFFGEIEGFIDNPRDSEQYVQLIIDLEHVKLKGDKCIYINF